MPSSGAATAGATTTSAEAARVADALEERDLVDRAKSGTESALDELITRHRQAAYLLALQLLGNREDALDVAQDSLLRFISTIDRFRSDKPVRPWLLRIVRNRAYDLRRRQKVRQAESLDAATEQGRPEPATSVQDPEAKAAQRQFQGAIWKTLNDLAPTQREILVLRDYQDLSYAEISTLLSIPQGTVMSRLHRARQSLRERLQAARLVPTETRSSVAKPTTDTSNTMPTS